MSKKTYFISPDLLRELDALRTVLEDQVLQDDDYGSNDSMRRHYVLRGFNEAVALITNLTHDYANTVEQIKERLINPSYTGMITNLDDYDEED